MNNMQDLVDYMVLRGVLHTSRIINAFWDIDRKYFVPEQFSEHIYIDAPLPIGKNQTISQPSTVAFMLEQLAPKEGENILDIGSGSGWTTSLLCHIVGEKGSVTGLERVDELVEQGKKNLAQFNFGDHCSIQKAGAQLGIPGQKFDRILVSASAEEIPTALFDQLKIGGVLVVPVQNSIFRFEKISDDNIKRDEYKGFAFVPLIV
ncbi:MAG: protein-L-isoaspartate O-methyltransferase [Campylobacterales bacterium]|nr:protein-L-isoaspartate O-methyltransferase [Campylobacterales bacterium]